MRIRIYILCLFALIPLLFSCAGFLDVNPKSEVTNPDMFSTEEGCEDALYGIYGKLGSSKALYSEELSYTLPEAMCGNIYVSGYSYTYLASRRYDLQALVDMTKTFWKELYQTNGYVNNIIANLKNRPDKEFRYMKLYKGEAYALRAFMHYTVAQYFAASFASTNQALKDKAIPYVTTYDYTSTPYSSLKDAYTFMIKDLQQAEDLLAEDATLIPASRNNAAGDFGSCRILHLNLYAVQALLARIYWIMGDMTNAETYALKVIDSQKFRFHTSEDYNSYEGGVLSMKETIFGIYSKTISNNYYQSHTGKESSTILLKDNYEEIYANSGPVEGSDIRASIWFDKTFNKCLKLHNAVSASEKPIYTGKSILGFNVITIPEMYYIVAEANLVKDNAKAMTYFDNVIAARGMVKFAERANVSSITDQDIYLERAKEFFMEGLQFVNMKRLQKDITIRTIKLTGTDDPTYVIPIPKSVEDNNRW